MYFKDLDTKAKNYFFRLKENFSGAFIFLAKDSNHLVPNLIDNANNIGINIVICVCSSISNLSVSKSNGFEIIAVNLEKVLSFNSSLDSREMDFLSFYFKNENKYGLAILDGYQFLENKWTIRLNELGFKSMDIFYSKSEISLESSNTSLYTNQGLHEKSNLFLVFRSSEIHSKNSAIDRLKVLLKNTFKTVNDSLNLLDKFEFKSIG